VHMAGGAGGLVALAYGVPVTGDRVMGGPDWMDKEIYRIEGKIPDDAFVRMQTMSGEERKAQALLMLRSLLAERFKLKVHTETREAPVYELVIAKGGVKLPPPNQPPAAADGAKAVAAQMAGGMAMSKTQVRVRNMTLDGMLQAPRFGLGGRLVVNKTGLTGTYNLTLNWAPEPSSPTGVDGAASPDDSGGESIFTALEEQLGLKLVPAKGPVEIVVIDHIERPSEN
jgi:bla regulator protein BlaR1